MTESKKETTDIINQNAAMVDSHNQVLDIPNNLEARIEFINNERRIITGLCVKSNKARGVLDGTIEPAKTLLLRLQLFMQWLETIEMSPALKARTPIDKALQLMFDRPEFHFEKSTRDSARALYQRWESQNWGQGEVLEEESNSEDGTNAGDGKAEASSSRKLKSSTSGTTAKGNVVAATTIRLPPPDHPIFGTEGIMHGVALKVSPRRKSYVLDSRYLKRDAKVFGHNGLQVGDWWPMQILALFNGAHGVRGGGIAGNALTGAYSVVTAGGPYEGLDQDLGDVLFYSGDRSHANTDPKEPFASSKATLALKTSQRLYKPVRVLRAAGITTSRRATLRPTVGIRYDGLYYVTAMQWKTNNNGGLYEQFKLERLEGQPLLSSVIESRPTASEVRDFDRREEGY